MTRRSSTLLLWVAMLAHMLLGDLSRFHQSGEGLRPSLYTTGLDATRAQPNARSGDEQKQGVDGERIVGRRAALLPGEPDLHAVLEAELAGDLIGQ